MRKYCMILLFVTCACYSQNKTIEIKLKSDSVITTDWIELSDFPMFQKPYVRIDSPSGPKIRINTINSYRGYDQSGSFRQLEVVRFNLKNKFHFTERKHQTDTTDKVKIYYDQVTYGLGVNSWRVKGIKYSVYGAEMRKLNYKNVKNDLIGLNNSNSELKKANGIRIMQYLCIAVGGALLTDALIKNWNPNPALQSGGSQLEFAVSGVLLSLPFVLEKPKQKRLIKALRNY